MRINKHIPLSVSIFLSASPNMVTASPLLVVDRFQYTVVQGDAYYERFEALKREWLNETKYLSNPRLLYSNEKYQKIIEMGYNVVPYLLEDLKKNKNDWFFALEKIIKKNPIKKDNAGNFNAMIEDWMEWAATNESIFK